MFFIKNDLSKERLTLRSIPCLTEPFYARLKIIQVHRRQISSKDSLVQVIELDMRKLRFQSDLKFPVSSNVVYALYAELLDCEFEFVGTIVKSIFLQKRAGFEYQLNYLEGVRTKKPSAGALLSAIAFLEALGHEEGQLNAKANNL